MRVYLDNAATTFVKPPAVKKAMLDAMNTMTSPGRGGHRFAMNAAEMAFACREAAAQLFNVDDPEKVVFTFNATHALNMAIRSLAKSGDKVIVSGYEHNAVMRPLREIGADVCIVRSPLFDEDAAVCEFERAISAGADLVVWNHVSNVFGFIQPVERIAEICCEKNIPLIIDASQSAGAVPINFSALKAEFIAMPGHKGLYGPQGTGLLLCGQVPKPFMSGGTGSNSALETMPDFLPDAGEAGTHNMPGIAGLFEGIRFVSRKGCGNILRHEQRLINSLARKLKVIDGVTVYAPKNGENIAGVLSFSVNGVESETAGELLGKKGVAVRAGLHCSPQAHKTAGTFETGTVRAGVSAFNTMKDIDYLAACVKEITLRR